MPKKKRKLGELKIKKLEERIAPAMLSGMVGDAHVAEALGDSIDSSL